MQIIHPSLNGKMMENYSVFFFSLFLNQNSNNNKHSTNKQFVYIYINHILNDFRSINNFVVVDNFNISDYIVMSIID